MRQVQRRVDDAVDAADMRYHDGRVDDAFGSQVVGFDEVVVVASRRAHDVGARVVAVVQVDFGAEVFVRRAGEEVHAAVEGQQSVAQLGDGADRRIYEDVVVAMAVGDIHEFFIGIVHGSRIDVVEFDAVLGGVFGGNDFFRPIDAAFVDVRYDDAFRLVFKADAVADGA